MATSPPNLVGRVISNGIACSYRKEKRTHLRKWAIGKMRFPCVVPLWTDSRLSLPTEGAFDPDFSTNSARAKVGSICGGWNIPKSRSFIIRATHAVLGVAS